MVSITKNKADDSLKKSKREMNLTIEAYSEEGTRGPN